MAQFVLILGSHDNHARQRGKVDKVVETVMSGSVLADNTGTIIDLVRLALLQDRSGWPPRWARPRWLARYLWRRLQQFNRRDRARKNVAHHYGLDGRLYSTFLDADRQYSCAYFETPDQSLDNAQLAKKRHIAAKLRSPSQALHEQAKTSTAATPNWRYGLPIGIMVLAAVVLLFGPKLFNRAPEDQSQSRESSESSSESQNVPAKSGSTSAATQTKPSARRPGNANQSSNISTPSAESAANIPEAHTASGQGEVVQQILPSVSKSARDTIHGTIKVRVKVAVDPSGNVERATFVTPGPSKYFARQAMQAAQQWKFTPAQANGQEAFRSWILRFGFKRSGTDAVLEQANP